MPEDWNLSSFAEVDRINDSNASFLWQARNILSHYRGVFQKAGYVTHPGMFKSK